MTMRAMERLFARMLADVAKKDDITAVTVKVEIEKNTERIDNIEEVSKDLRQELKNEVRSGVHIRVTRDAANPQGRRENTS